MAQPTGEPNGRPPFYKTPEELQEKIDAYFETVKKNPSDDLPPATITGLALYLGFESRQSFYDYEIKEGFAYTVKRARMRIEFSYELRLAEGKPVGAIFALKNMGWVDSREYKHEVSQPLVIDEKNDDPELKK